MNVERIKKLIKYLKKLPKKAEQHFDMDTWFSASEKRMKRNGFIKDRKDVMSCGTTACALGWASTVPEFRRDGLKVYAEEKTGDHPDGLNNTTRGAVFFGLAEGDFEELFIPPYGFGDASIEDFCQRAKEFLRERGVS